MLSELYIENFIIIKKLNIEFSQKYNVITGETGSGKSILVNSLQLLLGSRFQKNFLGNYGDKAIVEGKFLINEESKLVEFKELGYDLEDNELIVTRELSRNGKTSNRINGRNVNISILRQLMAGIMDIHSQNENQTLLKKDNYIDLIDSFNLKTTEEYKEKLKEMIFLRKTYVDELGTLNISSQEIDREKDLLKYQVEELESLDLENINEEDMFKEYSLLSNVEEIIKNLNEFYYSFKSDDYGQVDILTMIGRTNDILEDLKDKDDNLVEYSERLNDIYYELEDIVNDVNRYKDGLSIDDEKLNILNSNIEILTNLKRKYGGSIEELLLFKKNIYNRLDKLENIEKNISILNDKIRKIDMEIEKIADALTEIRKNISLKLEKNILDNIKELNMSSAKFKIEFKELDIASIKGKDDINFLISTNIGQDLEPLNKIASGGELSRIMLGFKTALANVDNVETLIFDEIDTGISGRTAQLVGEKLIDISNYRQIIVISHLPQISSLADYHLLIDKEEFDENTISKIYRIKENDRINEIARLIGGVNITETTIKQAREMLEQGKKMILSKRRKNDSRRKYD